MEELNPLQLTEEQMIDLYREEALSDSEGNDVLEVVECGDWEDGGKFQDAEIVFKDIRTDKFYSYTVTRSGSYFTHYDYEAYDKPVEVMKVTQTVKIEKWVVL